MNDNLWRQLEPLAHQIDEEIERILSSSDAQALKQIVKRAAGILPEGYSISLDITLNVFDSERGNVLPLSDTSLTASKSEEPYIAYGDCTPCRYLVDGEICEVPHDRCPHCWATWVFKIGPQMAADGVRPCPGCGYEVGNEVKLLLDNDTCPHCEEGKLSVDDPSCSRCGLAIDSSFIAWG